MSTTDIKLLKNIGAVASNWFHVTQFLDRSEVYTCIITSRQMMKTQKTGWKAKSS